MGRHDRAQGRDADRRRGISETASQKALASRKARAIEPGTYTVILEPRPAARFLSLLLGSLNARQAEEGRSFMSGAELGSTRWGRRCLVTPHHPERHRQQRAAPDADRPRRPCGASRSPGSRRGSSRTWPTTGSGRASRASRRLPCDAADEPGDGRRRSDDRADDQIHPPWTTGLVLLVHPRRRCDDAAQYRHDPGRAVPDRERRDRRVRCRTSAGTTALRGASTTLLPSAHRCRCTLAKPTTIPAPRLVPPMRIEDFRMTSISPAV